MRHPIPLHDSDLAPLSGRLLIELRQRQRQDRIRREHRQRIITDLVAIALVVAACVTLLLWRTS